MLKGTPRCHTFGEIYGEGGGEGVDHIEKSIAKRTKTSQGGAH